MACPVIAQENDANLVLSTYNISNGTDVLIGCKNFGQRLSGPSNITCVSGSWSDTTKPVCEFTGVLNTYEILVIVVGSVAAFLFLVCLVTICCLGRLYRRRKKDRRNDSDTESYPPSTINQKVGHAQYNSGYYSDDRRQSGLYEHKIKSEPYRYQKDPYVQRNGKNRASGRVENQTGYTYYTGRPTNFNFDNKAYDNKDDRRNGNYNNHRDSTYLGNQDKENGNDPAKQDYRWSGHIPRPVLSREDVREGREFF